MSDQLQPNSNLPSDEIDLGQIMQLVKRGLNQVFNAFLHLFLYLKKNIVMLMVLTVVGVAAGFGLNQIVNKGMKTEVIVKPNLESREYLYSVVDEINANIKANDTVFFKSMGIDMINLKGFKIMVEPVLEKSNRSNMDDDIKYLELLEKFQNDTFITSVVRTEISNKSSLNHRITFSYKETQDGDTFARKIMTYINSNGYFTELVKVYEQNAQERIVQDEKLVEQIDILIDGYSKKMMSTEEAAVSGRLIVDGEGESYITELFRLKNSFIRDIESKKLELLGQQEIVNIVNFGRKQQVQKSIFGKNIIRTPLILISLFFLWSIIKYLNKRAMKLS